MSLLEIVCLALIAWSPIATILLLRKTEELKTERAKNKTTEEAETADTEADATPIEIPENDKDWHIRTDAVERIRAGIVERLRTYPACIVTLDKYNKDSSLNHGEVHALILPFLQKGYFAYRYLFGYDVANVTRFRVTKHRDPEGKALEITEELLTKNAQL
ncbi:hypothetical protein [Porphyromonas sp. oral taxon 278]|uniref:hypothetical protein n=1 Tax=Porphyromonas sp. oral taxon 278 TaxID=712437 RepID=UPI0025F89550|nr:hypothetical protein [Porphyromonas sp. oral taxon 278]